MASIGDIGPIVPYCDWLYYQHEKRMFLCSLELYSVSLKSPKTCVPIAFGNDMTSLSNFRKFIYLHF